MKKGLLLEFLLYVVVSTIISFLFPNLHTAINLMVSVIFFLVIKQLFKNDERKQSIDKEKDERYEYIKARSAWLTLVIAIYCLVILIIISSIVDNIDLQVILSIVLISLVILYSVIYLLTEKRT